MAGNPAFFNMPKGAYYNMLVMGIESSCDETAISVLRDGKEVLSSNVYSQIETHKVFGGVVPEVAAREHLKIIHKLAIRTLEDAKVSIEDIDAIAVTRGPGISRSPFSRNFLC